MVCPCFLPALSADTPDDSIILHQITNIRRNRRKYRAQIAQHRALFKAAQRRFHCGQDGGNHAFLQNIFCARQINRNAAAVKDKLNQRAVAGKIRTNHGNIPIAAAGTYELHNLLSRTKDFLIR